MTIDRKSNTINQEAKSNTSSFSVLASIKSNASTLNGINNAVKAYFGDSDFCFESEEEVEKSLKEGFVSFHRDGFILWVDGE